MLSPATLLGPVRRHFDCCNSPTSARESLECRRIERAVPEVAEELRSRAFAASEDWFRYPPGGLTQHAADGGESGNFLKVPRPPTAADAYRWHAPCKVYI